MVKELYLQCGLLELKDSQLSFEQTVAHEYVHLVFENASRKAKDSTVSRAKKAFRQIGIIPKYRIYQDWLSKVEQFFKTSGGTDPYAEGTWFAGALLKSANTLEKRNKLIKLSIDSAKIGKSPKDLDLFYQDLIRKLEAFFMSDHGPFWIPWCAT